ncbi:MAG: hypothetical protein LBN97_08160, partial [Oscillospiraceae bacterium]|nr:hypothetical protein [Oscillospiraceae bacterium]
ISPLAACEALDVLNLHNLNVRDYSPLLECKKLKHLFLTEAQRENFERLGEVPFTVEYGG